MKNRITSRELPKTALPAGYKHIVYDLTDSTMNDMNKAMEDAVASGDNIHGLVIQALQQTKGRGTRDLNTGLVRQWASSQENLMFSMAVHKSGLHHREIETVAALAVYRSIKAHSFFEDSSQIYMKKNDIYMNGKKVCGVLSHKDFCKDDWCSIGIGINVAHAPQLLGVSYQAGCLQDFGWPKDKKPEELLNSFLETFQYHYEHQLKYRIHAWKEFGLMGEDGILMLSDETNPHSKVSGKFKGYETDNQGHDYFVLEGFDGKNHKFLVPKTLIQTQSAMVIVTQNCIRMPK